MYPVPKCYLNLILSSHDSPVDYSSSTAHPRTTKVSASATLSGDVPNPSRL